MTRLQTDLMVSCGVVAFCAALCYTLFAAVLLLAPASAQEAPKEAFQQHDTMWSDHVRTVMVLCAERAVLEAEAAFTQGATPEQQREIGNSVFYTCLKITKITI